VPENSYGASFKLLLEGIPVSFFDESGQIATILRDSLERKTGCRALTVLDGLGDFGGDFLFQFDVVEAVFHIEHSSVKVKGYYKYNLAPCSCQAEKVIFQQKIKDLCQNVRKNALRVRFEAASGGSQQGKSGILAESGRVCPESGSERRL
jgi:hypothetical protein